ncbi:Metal-dependent hydrolase YbeY, involved in rRNA and/or ribosome maturation and assembly [Enhygromyxa salina]|uniref:Endoribonuclease YbeY n=1 Tax=Enhygromyxa salina TaxID=215803 RepID=A0A0C1ZUR8_9BACT|nr:rRNA maturation RNase YbeY [Enhygromyxa salina]KIG14793.1 Metal-dependent hydrolase YbeY, involved in rRNA and/or ribosome maturation and assembly [Enhygromyxa salina]
MLATPSFMVADRVRERVPPRVLALLERRTRRAAKRVGIDADQLRWLGLRIVDDAEMAELHLTYMGEAGPTDVLSFRPAVRLVGEGAGDRGSLGDVVIDWDAVERQARGSSHAARLDEATVLIVHGLVHLLGHDHRDRGEGRRMHRVERRVLRALQVADPPRPYAARLLRSRDAIEDCADDDEAGAEV